MFPMMAMLALLLNVAFPAMLSVPSENKFPSTLKFLGMLSTEKLLTVLEELRLMDKFKDPKLLIVQLPLKSLFTVKVPKLLIEARLLRLFAEPVQLAPSLIQI